MKTKHLFLVISAFALSFFSCNSDKDVPGYEQDSDDGAMYIPRILTEDIISTPYKDLEVVSDSNEVFFCYQLLIDEKIDFREISDEEILAGKLTVKSLHIKQYLEYDPIGDKYVPCGLWYDRSHKDVIFSIEDIESLNLTTREVIFSSSMREKMKEWMFSFTPKPISIFFNDKLLFGNMKATICYDSWAARVPVFYGDYIHDGISNLSKIYLIDSRPWFSEQQWFDCPWPNEIKTEWRSKLDINAEKIKPQWEFLFRCLELHGKTIKGEGDTLPWWRIYITKPY